MRPSYCVWNKFKNKIVRQGLCLCCWDDRDNALVILSLVEVYGTVNESVEGIVLALSDTSTWEVLVATLAHDDVACYNLLTTENLNTKSLCC